MTRSGRVWPWWRWGLTGLSALGLALSAYLAWHYLNGGSVVGCGGGSPCDHVLNGRWSAIGGSLPVSGLAAGTYLATLLASLFIGPYTEPPIRRLAWRAILMLTAAAAGSAVWFTIVQKWLIGAFCPYCLATHMNGLLLATLVFWQAPKQFEDDSNSRRVIGRLPAMGMALVGLALAGLMAICQMSITSPAADRGGESQQNMPAVDPHAVPLVGSPAARYVVTLLFDYNCPHCQQLHLMLDEAVRRYDGNLAFALCPAPLNSNCNPSIPRDVDEFKDSCELARIALTVWVARRDAFQDFDRWMFSFESGDHWHPRTLYDTKAKAVELLGQAKFDAARGDPWIDGYLQSSVRIYGATVQNGNNAVPKLVYASRWVIPQPDSADDLISILHDSLGLPRP